MGISNVTSMNRMPSMHMITAALTEPKIKNIQNELTNVQLQMQKLASKKELSTNEKTDEQKKLQKEVSSLNTKLKQQQEALRKSQKRELMLAKLQEDKKLTQKETSEDNIQTQETSKDKADDKALPTKQDTKRLGTVILQNSNGTVILTGGMKQDGNRGIDTEKKQDDKAKEENTPEKETKTIDSDTSSDINLSAKKMHAIVSAGSSIQQANRQGTIIARTKDGIVILKGEIRQDELRDVNTERKQDELEKMEKKEQIATSFQFSVLGKANHTMKSATETNMAKIKGRTQSSAENSAFVNAVKASQEENLATQQNFYVSFK